MDADRYISILEALLPFLKDVYPDGHRFVQDNDIYKAYLKASPWLFLAEWGELVQTSPRMSRFKSHRKFVARNEGVFEKRGEAPKQSRAGCRN